jgi:hypothetical protein
MPFSKHLTLRLTPLALLLAAPGCGPQVVMKPLFPSHADLQVEPKPVPTDAIVTDPKAADRYNADVESWGERGWLTVARICRWAVANGASGLNCPATSKGSN